MSTFRRWLLVFSFLVCFAPAGSSDASGGPQKLENEYLCVTVSPDTAMTSVLDKKTGILWEMDPSGNGTGYLVVVNRNDYSWMKEVLPEEQGKGLFRSELRITIGQDGKENIVFNGEPSTGATEEYSYIRLEAPIATLRATRLELEYRLARNSPDIDFVARVEGPQRQFIKEIAFPTGFSVEPAERGYLIVPHYVGLIVPNGLYEFDVDRRLYQGAGQEAYNMRFAGTVKEGTNGTRSAAVATFNSLYTKVNMKSRAGRLSATPRMFRAPRALNDWEKEYSIRYHFLAGGDYVAVAKYYRQWAMDHGLFRSYRDKVADYPAVAALTLMSEDGGGGFLFSDKTFSFQKLIDRVAELRSKGVQRAKFLLYGWGGDYHTPPDTLPAKQEYGGNEGLIRLSEAIHAAGYDLLMNDIIIGSTEAAPSHSEEFLARQENGAPYFCGNWGSDAYIINASWQYKFIEEHMPKIMELFHPTHYYYDGQTNMPPVDDFSSQHPQTLDDDLYWRGKIFELTHHYVGVLGSESPNDWAVPYIDWTYDSRDGYDLEDRTNQDGVKGFIVPLWYLVYHDALIARHSWPSNYRTKDPTERAVRVFLKTLRAGTFIDAPLRKEARTESLAVSGMQGLEEWVALSAKERQDLAKAIAEPFLKLVFYQPMTDHEFLSDDKFVERTKFGGDVEVYVNGSDKPFRLREDTTLAPYGFLVSAPTHVAYSVLSIGGQDFASPFLAAITSADGLALKESREVQVLAGFGQGNVSVANSHSHAAIDGGSTLNPDDKGIYSIPADRMRAVTVHFSED